MSLPWEAFAVSFGLVLVAELGDKTQLVVLSLGARGHPLRVAAGAAVAFFVLSALAVAAGGLIAEWVPQWAVHMVAGALFVAFGILTLRDGEAEPDEAASDGRTRRGPFMSALLLVGVAEFGDKTQLATAALAASTASPVAVGLGAALAMSALAFVTALAGGAVAKKVPQHIVERSAGILFLVLGAVFLGLGTHSFFGG